MGDECLEVGGCRQAGAAWEGVEVREGGWGMATWVVALESQEGSPFRSAGWEGDCSCQRATVPD